MAGEAAVVLIEFVLAGVLYALLRPVSRSVSLAAALARAGEGMVMAAGNLVTSIMTLVMVGGAGYLTAFSTEQRDALALAFQEGNDQVVLVWGLLFGLHLLLLGWLVQRSGFLPRFVGVLLALAGDRLPRPEPRGARGPRVGRTAVDRRAGPLGPRRARHHPVAPPQGR